MRACACLSVRVCAHAHTRVRLRVSVHLCASVKTCMCMQVVNSDAFMGEGKKWGLANRECIQTCKGVSV